MLDPQIIPDPKTREVVRALLRRIEILESSQRGTTSTVGALTSDHGRLSGLTDDDHGQYLDTVRHDTTARHGPSVVDHGSIGGLTDDDHAQYHNDARGDLRYAPIAHVGAGGAAHADAVAAGAAGFMTGADKTKLDGIAAGAQVGTVTSVGLSSPSDFNVSGSPVTGAGTLTFSWATAPTSSNTANAIVKRGASGEFSMGALTASSATLTGAVSSSSYWRSTRSAATDGALAARYGADTSDRFLVRADGKIEWGAGAAAQDTSLFRDAANSLKTDDTFSAAAYKVGATAGIDATVALAPLTGGGAAGSLTFTKGILTAYTAPT